MRLKSRNAFRLDYFLFPSDIFFAFLLFVFLRAILFSIPLLLFFLFTLFCLSALLYPSPVFNLLSSLLKFPIHVDPSTSAVYLSLSSQLHIVSRNKFLKFLYPFVLSSSTLSLFFSIIFCPSCFSYGNNFPSTFLLLLPFTLLFCPPLLFRTLGALL